MENYPVSFSKTRGSFCNWSLALNRAKTLFSVFTFWQKIQVLLLVYGAAGSFWGVGLAYVYMCEWFRSKKTNQNLCIHDFQDLILKDLFKYFFMPIWYKSWPITSIPSISDHARNFKPIPCTKRFDCIGLVFFMYFN